MQKTPHIHAFFKVCCKCKVFRDAYCCSILFNVCILNLFDFTANPFSSSLYSNIIFQKFIYGRNYTLWPWPKYDVVYYKTFSSQCISCYANKNIFPLCVLYFYWPILIRAPWLWHILSPKINVSMILTFVWKKNTGRYQQNKALLYKIPPWSDLKFLSF